MGDNVGDHYFGLRLITRKGLTGDLFQIKEYITAERGSSLLITWCGPLKGGKRGLKFGLEG